MELITDKKGSAFVVKAIGRLDASWTDFFTEAFLTYIRNGEHDLIIDASGIVFLSSAGIRSLVRIHKDLSKLKGRFRIINANDFVINTLQMTGFGKWLVKDEAEVDLPDFQVIDVAQNGLPPDCYLLDTAAFMKLSAVNHWVPWNKAESSELFTSDFKSNTYAVGVGSPQSSELSNELLVGDFLAVAGNIIFQPPQEESHPDFLQPEESFIPKFRLLRALKAEGKMSHLLRFKPEKEGQSFAVTELLERSSSLLKKENFLFVMLAESDGLVGACLIQSPTGNYPANNTDGLDLKDWLSFTAEKAFVKDQTLVVGFGLKNPVSSLKPLLRQGVIQDSYFTHIHAAVFPYQPLQNGLIDLATQVTKFLNGPPPKAFLHLIDDQRPGNGLGESKFSRGAIWCAALTMEDNQ